jgi:hypothetical protein
MPWSVMSAFSTHTQLFLDDLSIPIPHTKHHKWTVQHIQFHHWLHLAGSTGFSLSTNDCSAKDPSYTGTWYCSKVEVRTHLLSAVLIRTIYCWLPTRLLHSLSDFFTSCHYTSCILSHTCNDCKYCSSSPYCRSVRSFWRFLHWRAEVAGTAPPAGTVHCSTIEHSTV